MKRIDRRALFASGAAAALLAAAGLTPDKQPKRGGRLRIALARSSNSMAALARGAVYETLTEVAPDGVLRGELATAWHSSADARHWEFTLRDDVLFHDARRFDASDVVASLQLGGGAQIHAASASRLVIELTDGNPALPYLLAAPDHVIAPGGDLGLGIGTGLFALRRHQANRHFLAERVASHYREDRAGWADFVDAVTIPDAHVRAEALRDGFVDIAELPASEGLRDQPDLQFHPSAEDMALASRADVGIPRIVSPRAPLDDARLAERWWLA